jgi:hypothetical protein
MIWRVISRYAQFAGITVGLSPGAAYAILDGLFQQALLHQLAGDESAAEHLQADVVRVLDTLAVRSVADAGMPTSPRPARPRPSRHNPVPPG